MVKFEVTEKFLRARQVEPDEFEKGSFKTIRLSSGVKAIVGRKKERRQQQYSLFFLIKTVLLKKELIGF